MKRTILLCAGVTALLLAGFPSAARSEQTLFDQKKMRQELEVMESVISTALRFALEELQPQEEALTSAAKSHLGVSAITSFYLYGQGAVFHISGTGIHHFPDFSGTIAHALAEAQSHAQAALAETARNLAEMQKELQEKQATMQKEIAERQAAALTQQQQAQAEAVAEGVRQGVAAGVREGVFGVVGGGGAGGVAGGGAGGVGVAPGAAAARMEKVKARMEETEKKLKEQRERQQARRAQFWEQIDRIKDPLLEVLAKHGDSLSQLRPNEYITFMITDQWGDPFSLSSNRQFPQSRLFSVQKSAITDYKSGKLSLEDFKSRVLDYTN